MVAMIFVCFSIFLQVAGAMSSEIVVSSTADEIHGMLASGAAGSASLPLDKMVNLVRKEAHTEVHNVEQQQSELSRRKVKRHVDDEVVVADSSTRKFDNAVPGRWPLPMSTFVGVTSWLQKLMVAFPARHRGESLIELHSNSTRRAQPSLEGYRDDQCSEETAGYTLPKKAELPDNCCVSVKSSKDDSQTAMDVMGVRMNLKIICLEDDKRSQMGIIFGTDCSSGFEDDMILEFDKDETLKLGEGKCARGVNYKNNLEEYMKFQSLDDITELPKCMTRVNWLLYGLIIGGVLFCLVCSGIGIWCVNREDPKERRKRLREEKQKEEESRERRLSLQQERKSRLSLAVKADVVQGYSMPGARQSPSNAP